MKLLKKIFNSKPIILLRNIVGFRPIKFFFQIKKTYLLVTLLFGEMKMALSPM